ncbi:MAG: type II secretion system protein [Campylobacterales bacterium]|nr:type II secretion system protein [Campylobacterales bacterium]
MRKGFTFIEMLFVIVIMGILAKFGSEIFRNVYLNYNQSTANNELQIDTELVLQQIANRFQYRIKDSVIAKVSGEVNFKSISSADANSTVFEWIGYDIDGWLGDGTSTLPTWTGFIDLNALDTGNANQSTLFSPGTDTGRINTVIAALSPSGAGIGNAVIFFTGENADVQTDYGWDGVNLTTQRDVAAHRIDAGTNADQLVAHAAGANFTDTDIYEQYKLAWTAYALEISTDGNLTLYYDYRPWEGGSYNDPANASSALLMQNVTTAKIQAVGEILNLQVCVGGEKITSLNGDGGYSICKEKVIF